MVTMIILKYCLCGYYDNLEIFVYVDTMIILKYLFMWLHVLW